MIDAHEDGVVHRDLKPANLFIEQRSGRAQKIKVLDFGISKIAPGEDVNASITATRSLLGSPGYRSPEQNISTRNVDARSDVWSLGAILYELLSADDSGATDLPALFDDEEGAAPYDVSPSP